MQNVFENRSNFPTAHGKELQAGMVVSDPFTGEVKGIVGGLGKRPISGDGTEQLKRHYSPALRLSLFPFMHQVLIWVRLQNRILSKMKR